MKYQTLYKKIASLDKVEEVAKEIIRFLPESAIVLLKGNLAAGKTTLVSTIAKLLGAESVVSSPTFSLQQIYGDNLYHYDFYRVDFDEILNLGLIDEFEKEGLHFIEWTNDELKELLISAGFKIFEIEIVIKEDKREYILKAINA